MQVGPAALANALTATASALALQQLLQASVGTPATPVYANLRGNAAAISDQVTELVSVANKDAKIGALDQQVRELMVQRQNLSPRNNIQGRGGCYRNGISTGRGGTHPRR